MEITSIKAEQPEPAAVLAQIMNIKQEPEEEFELILPNKELENEGDSDVEFVGEENSEAISSEKFEISFSDSGFIFITSRNVRFECKVGDDLFKSQVLGDFGEKSGINAGEAKKPVRFDTIHQGNPQNQCGFCKKLLGSKKTLNKHLRNVHGPKENKFACGVCRKMFTSPVKARTHEGKVHSEKTKPTK